MRRFLGKKGADEALSAYAKGHNINWQKELTADAELVAHAEKLLAGIIGSASARVVVSSVVKEEPLGMEELMNILDETRQVIAYSHQLEQTTAELKEANERLKELDRLKDDFISTVTHELRTPLTSARSLAEILHDNPDLEPAKRSQFLDIIVKESERLSRLINQVLDFQKIESGKMGWELKELNFKDIIKDAVASSMHSIREKNIALDVDLPASTPPVAGDRDRLIQVMVNLISNAVKFCDDAHGWIGIRLTIRPHQLAVAVSDNGIGISPADQEIIFEKFHQVTNSAKGRPQVSGLGLAIARRIIDRHGGTIRVESRPGSGATFVFTLPVNPAQYFKRA